MSYNKIKLFPNVKYDYLIFKTETPIAEEIDKSNDPMYVPRWEDFKDSKIVAPFYDDLSSSLIEGLDNPITSWVVYRRKRNEPIQHMVAEVDRNQSFINDYVCSNRNDYIYEIALSTEIELGLFLQSDTIRTDWYNYSLTSIKEVADGIYVPDQIWLFEVNLTSTNIIQNLDVTTFGTFTRTPKVSKGESNYQTMGISCLLGGITCGTNMYYEPIELLEKWQEFVGSSDLCIWKDIKGAIKLGQIIPNPSSNYIDNLTEQPTEISFEFVETDDISNISVYSTSDEIYNTIYKTTIEVDSNIISSIPTQVGSLTYTGETLTPTWSGYNSSKLVLGGETSGINAGGYTATFTPIDGHKWFDGTTAPKAVNWNIERAVIETLPVQSGVLIYTGGTLTPTWINYNNNQLVLSGTTSAINTGTYTALFTPVDGYKWIDGTITAKAVVWNILSVAISTPTQLGNVVYTGNTLTPMWGGYDSSQLMLSGETSGINAGTYVAIFTPIAGYGWSDGTTSARPVEWSISRATGSLSINPTAITLNNTTPSNNITVTRLGDGIITATSSNTNVATVSVNENIVTVNNVDQTGGSATITVSVSQGTNYTAPTNATCLVTASFFPAKRALNDMSWEDIRTVIDGGLAEDYWAVGDAKQITINGRIGKVTGVNLTTWAVIIGFNHNSSREGNNKVHFQIGRTAQNYSTTNAIALVDNTYGSYSNVAGSFAMNPAANAGTSTNSNGWNSSKMRTVVLGSDRSPTTPTANTFLAALPSDLRAVMKPCTKYTDNIGGGGNVSGNVSSTTDYLFLLSEYEVFGTRNYANSYEQNYQRQYAYYIAGNSKNKYRHSSTSQTSAWWFRSPAVGNVNEFCFALDMPSASPQSNNSGYCFGIAPGFCV